MTGYSPSFPPTQADLKHALKAADAERDRLRAVNAELVEALVLIADQSQAEEPEHKDWGGLTGLAENYGFECSLWEAARIARAAPAKHAKATEQDEPHRTP